MEKTNLTISVDKKDKEMFQDLVNKLGLNISVAFNMFVKQSIRNNSLPLDLTLNELDSVSDRLIDRYGGLSGIRDNEILKYCVEGVFQTFGGKELYPDDIALFARN